MSQRASVILFCAAMFLFASTAASASGDIVAGKKKAQVCAACHGADGNAVDPQYPRLAGQYQDYLAQALHEYQTGTREHPDMGIHRSDAIMKGMAANLSDQDIDDLAAYFSSLPGKLGDLHGKIQGGD